MSTQHLSWNGARLDAPWQGIERLSINFEAAGFAPRKLVEFNRDGALFARFFFVKDPDGYEIEVMQRHGRYR